MVFITAANEPTMFLMLTEADCNDMRNGRTKFVDETATKRKTFTKVIISLHKNQTEIENILKKAGHSDALKNMPAPIPHPQEGKCKGCNGIILEVNLLDGRCITCWKELAKIRNS